MKRKMSGKPGSKKGTDGARVTVTLADPGFPGTAAAVRRAARPVLDGERIRGGVAIHFVPTRTMARWNGKLFGRRGATDVITLCYNEGVPVPDPEGWAGDILVCWGVAVRQARRYGVTPAAEWRRYLVHGLLHLAGYEHEGVGPRVAARMRRREEVYLAAKNAK